MFAYPPLDAAPALDTAATANQAGQAAASLAKRVTPYRAVLQNPTCSLATNSAERPDIATSAILGYN